MPHYQRNFKCKLLFLFFHLLLLIYGTDIQKCTCCAINSGTFCSACEASLYLYSPTIAHDNDDKKIQIFCEKCEENSTDHVCHVKMAMEKKFFCTRCAIEVLSFYFPRQTIENTKSYCVKIILNSLITGNAMQNTTESVLNDLVNNKFNKKIKILEMRKKQNKSYNLFLIMNEILSQFKLQTLSRRTCENTNCMKANFSLIKVPCCNRFICIACIINRTLLETKHQKCVMCENGYICRNMQEFEKTFRSTFSGFAEQAPMLITQERQKEMEDVILKLKKSKKNGGMKYAQFSVLTKKWLMPAYQAYRTSPSIKKQNSYKMVIKFWMKNVRMLTACTLLWLNLIFGYFIFGPKFYENYSFLVWNFIFTPSISWLLPISSWVLTLLESSMPDKNSYAFY